MTLAPFALLDDYGCDTIFVFSPADASRYYGTTWKDPGGVERTFGVAGRYVEDTSPGELDGLVTARWRVLFYMHVDRPSWQATGAKGHLKGLAGAQKLARLIGSVPASLIIDMEGVGDPGTNADAYVRECAKPIRDLGFGPGMYEGYLDGFDMATRVALLADGAIDGIDSDYGQRTPPPGYGFCGKQFAQQIVAGIEVDPHHYFAAQNGRGFIAVGLDPDPATASTDPAPPLDVEPHQDTEEPHNA